MGRSKRKKQARKTNGFPSVQKDESSSGNKLYRGILGAIVIGVALAVYTKYGHFLTFRSLRTHRGNILQFVAANPRVAPVYYILTIICVIGLTIPGATLLSLTGGFLFGQPWAAVYAWLGCGTGALVCFIFVRTVLGDCCLKRVSGNTYFDSFKHGVERHQFMYLLYIRYMLVCPFWFVNSCSALLNVPLLTFAGATYIAIIPGSFIYTTAGSQLGFFLEQYEGDSVTVTQLLRNSMFSKEMVVCWSLLAFCILIPMVVKCVTGDDSDTKAQEKKDQ